MFWRLLQKSLLSRKSHLAVSIVAVTMGALLVAATTTISFNIKDKISRELRAYGPNLSILPIKNALGIDNGAVFSEDSYLLQADIKALKNDPDILGISPVLTGNAKVNDQSIVVQGLEWDAAQKIHPWWEPKGSIPNQTQVLIGSELAKKYNLFPQQTVKLVSGQKVLNTVVSGIVQTGGEEDNQILMPLESAQSFLGLEGKVSKLEISVLSTYVQVEAKGAEIEKKVHGSKAKVVQQVAHAEQRLLEKIQALMYFVTLGVLVVSLLSIAGTMTTTVLQRRKEIGTMKAIGASNTEIVKLFMSEATVFGIVGGIAGLALGFGLANVIGKTVFSTAVSLPLVVVPLTVGSACIVTWLASSRPVMQAVSIQPAITLRGE